jgi:hypothetical protein
MSAEDIVRLHESLSSRPYPGGLYFYFVMPNGKRLEDCAPGTNSLR